MHEAESQLQRLRSEFATLCSAIRSARLKADDSRIEARRKAFADAGGFIHRQKADLPTVGSFVFVRALENMRAFLLSWALFYAAEGIDVHPDLRQPIALEVTPSVDNISPFPERFSRPLARASFLTPFRFFQQGYSQEYEARLKEISRTSGVTEG